MKMLLLTLPMLLAACATGPSRQPNPADKFLVPTVVAYTKKDQQTAALEMDVNCEQQTPVLCRMIIDYGKMRDSARAILGKKADLAR